MLKELEDALAQLRLDPRHPVRARVEDLTVELRAVEGDTREGSAADLFAEIGPWAGESTGEALELLAGIRRRGGSRPVSPL
jgi:hypothetical protein